MTKRKMPPQKPGKSEQGYETPWVFTRAVEKYFGVKLQLDLAATEGTQKAPRFISPEEDSFTVNWSRRCKGAMWLNPPFGNIPKWAAKCALEAERFKHDGQRIFLLTPAAISTNYFARDIWPFARVYAITGRMTFVGEEAGYIKDLMLSVYGGPSSSEFDTWGWRKWA